MSFLVDIIAMVFGMPRALFPEIAHVDFGGPESGGLAFALLFAGIPIGAVLGGVFSGWVSRVERHGLAVIVSVLVWGLAMFGFGLAVSMADSWHWPMLLAAVLMLVVGGAADMASAAFRMSMLQSAASDAVRGRLQGVFTVVVVGGPRIADVAHGAVAVSIGAAATAAGGGLLVVVVTVLAAVAFPAFVRYRVIAATGRSQLTAAQEQHTDPDSLHRHLVLPRMAAELLAVLEDRVDLPALAVGRALDPELVLPRVATGGVALVDRGQADLGQPALLGIDRVGVDDLDAEVVHRTAVAGVLDQDELQRGLGNGEVGVAGPDLRRLGAEQPAVEGDRLLQVVDVEGELYAGHVNLRARY